MKNRNILCRGRYGLTCVLSVCILLLLWKCPVWAAADQFSVTQWNRELQALESIGRKTGIEICTDQKTQDMTETVPVCYDPRSLQLVTPVRDQQNLALCWDYAGIALMESALLIKGYRGADVDLSELHGAYAAYHLQADASSFGQIQERQCLRLHLPEWDLYRKRKYRCGRSRMILCCLSRSFTGSNIKCFL